jgi:hypothetical protein
MQKEFISREEPGRQFREAAEWVRESTPDELAELDDLVPDGPDNNAETVAAAKSRSGRVSFSGHRPR